MSTEDLSLRILVEIRDQVQATNQRMDQLEQSLGGRIDRVEQRLGARIEHLGARIESGEAALIRRIMESEIRTATAINGLAGTLRDVGDKLRDRLSRGKRDID